MPDWSNLPPEEILLALEQNRSSGTAVCAFIDTHQYAPLLDNPAITLWGGYPEAQLRAVCTGTERAKLDCWQLPRAALPANLNSVKQLRQACTSSGLHGWQLGDVIYGSSALVLFALAATPLQSVLPGLQALETFVLPEAAPERLTCASLRLDAVISALFRVSRGEAQTAIEYGFIFRNFRLCTQRTAAVKAGDQLVYRTKGRIEMREIEDSSKSGRQWLLFRRFPS